MNIQGIGQSYHTGMSSGASGLASSRSISEMDASTIMDQDDANQDGFLTIDETPLSDDMFSSADADSDSQLSTGELEDMLTSMSSMRPGGGMMEGMGPPPPPDATAIFDSEDTDDSGTISTEESSLSSEIFSSLDTNQDGQISLEELELGMSQNQEQMASAQGAMPGMTTSQEDAVSAYRLAMDSIMNYSGGTYNSSNLNEFLEITV